MSGRILVGADVGGSRTRVSVSRDGGIVASADGPGAAVRPGRALASAATIAEVVRRALGAAGELRGAVLVVGAAGVGRPAEARELQQALRGEALADLVVVTTDMAIALEGAIGDKPGIVLSAGTGSIAMARDADGTEYRAGGYGWQMGDEGSGYAIGRSALGAVSRAADGRGAETKLAERLLAATRSVDFDALVRWTATAGPPEVASLAQHVLETARAGDEVAMAIVHYAAEELAGLALSLQKRMRSPVPIGLTGGLLADEALRSAVAARLEKDGATVRQEPIDAVAGALRIAERAS